MSANLLADLDSYYSKQQNRHQRAVGAFGGKHETTVSDHQAAPDAEGPNPWADVNSQSAWSAQPKPVVGSTPNFVNDDDWGDFEGKSFEQNPGRAVKEEYACTSSLAGKSAAAFDPWGGFDNPGPAPTSSHQAIVERLGTDKRDESVFFPRPQPKTESSPLHGKKGAKPMQDTSDRDENVLFDAEDVSDDEAFPEDEDDFGDFEAAQIETSVAQPPKNAGQSLEKQTGVMSLIDFEGDTITNSTPPEFKQTQATNANVMVGPKYTGVDPFADLEAVFGPAAPVAKSSTAKHVETGTHGVGSPLRLAALPSKGSAAKAQAQHRTAAAKHEHQQMPKAQPKSETIVSRPDSTNAEDEDFDAWGDWDEQIAQPKAISSAEKSSRSGPSRLPTLLKPGNSVSELAPTNVPPPALLLPLFPPILNVVQSELLRPLGESSQEDRDAITWDPSIHRFLNSYLTIATVLARIIAGRKLRWKRDTLLSQSMRIGQAGGRATGMKLASIDKGENTREEREIANVVRLWRLQVGKLRSALTASGVHMTVPEIAETLPVRMTQASEGAVPAPKPCALCALKRNERVPKVDTNVEDTFGEWWVEHWGHRACKDFWDSEERNLDSR